MIEAVALAENPPCVGFRESGQRSRPMPCEGGPVERLKLSGIGRRPCPQGASLSLQSGVLSDEVPVQLAHGLHVSVATGQPGLERLDDGLKLGNPSS